ncbi:MAG: glycosyl hydrolase family 28 protein [Balneolales bacterium]|nr:glycosyl hydrolase family 28 protein [Balneolales bacterium]
MKAVLKKFAPMATLAILLTNCSGNQVVDVRDFGAVGDSLTINTQSIQAAINAAAERNGGTVIIQEGNYITGTIELKSNVTLAIEEGAALLGSTRQDDYSDEIATLTDGIGQKFGYALIYAKGVENIKLTGEGTIDGRGFTEYFSGRRGDKRPSLIRIEDSKNITVEKLTLKNSAFWVQHYRHSSDILVDGITVDSRVNGNNDGIDIDGCERVIIQNSSFDTSDDSIVLKSLSNREVRDVLVQNNWIRGDKSAFKTGTESVAGFRNIIVKDLEVEHTRGINLYTVDGGIMDSVEISNIKMKDSYAVILLRLGARMNSFDQETEAKQEPGSLSNISISNIIAEGVTVNKDFISGIPGHSIRNVQISDVTINFAESADFAFTTAEVPERIGSYPVDGMFGPLPSLGFMIRHARGIELQNIHYTTPEEVDSPALIKCIHSESISMEQITLNGQLAATTGCN